ncbi:TauD/TfdA family dioxygenase [Bradyrhizobium brasilense]|uniref:TauD/TfdA family dioxygenase n=1 Tax=Bradyrhizobium brasilense TaxID=1419277 RepID=UPI003CC652AD
MSAQAFLRRFPASARGRASISSSCYSSNVSRLEFTVRFRWHPNSIAFWDNRTTFHLAPRDIFSLDFDRQLYRITLRGAVPVGVDGKPSTSIEGDRVDADSPENVH